MSSSEYLVEPVPAPPLNIPESKTSVSVSIIDSTAWVKLPMSPFFEPAISGKTHLSCPAYSFLITHIPSKRKILFDLGVPKDWTNMAPTIVNRIQEGGWEVKVDKDIADILVEHEVPLNDIEAIIWSHHHWDHTGEPSKFPTATDIVVGPGFKEAYTPGYPTNPDSALRDKDFADRNLREVACDTGLKLGRFDAHDYFDDGSFYLLHTPGHTIGHLCGLARTTTTTTTTSTASSSIPSSTFILMGGDACHLGGEFRPTPYLPLPRTLATPHLHPHAFSGAPCPGALFEQIHRNPSAGATQPFFVPTQHISHDVAQAEWTIAGLTEFDAAENVFVVLAHDEQLLPLVDFFPATLNAWRERDYAETARWRFLGDFEEAVKAVEAEKGSGEKL